jgi:transcriptional regulator with XRE-family HTH domain
MALYTWETGRHRPSIEMLSKMAIVLGVPISDFYEEESMQGSTDSSTSPRFRAEKRLKKEEQ